MLDIGGSFNGYEDQTDPQASDHGIVGDFGSCHVGVPVYSIDCLRMI